MSQSPSPSPRRVVVCGPRDWVDAVALRTQLERIPRDVVIVHGDCPGADRIAGHLARFLGFTVEAMPADWFRCGCGRSCVSPAHPACAAQGPIRNRAMLRLPGVIGVLACSFSGGLSRGTGDCVRQARALGLPVWGCIGQPTVQSAPRIYSKRAGAEPAPAGAVYVGRPSPWGNPFTSPDKLDNIHRFVAYATERLAREPAWLAPLRGQHLVCWCHPAPCHASVLLKLANAPIEPAYVCSQPGCSHAVRLVGPADGIARVARRCGWTQLDTRPLCAAHSDPLTRELISEHRAA